MGSDDVVQRLQALAPYGDALQKACDAADWADPRFLLGVREGLRLRPRIHARQWEATAAFLGLAGAGKLHAGARGIAFGSGREALTFAVAARVAHLTATDLYEAGTAWTVARTSDPLGFVLGAAPPGFPAERLAVHHMDMREIGYPDASFDFCYSISAFEHIGEEPDFLRHFREVRRVLKPDGLYALTTEALFGETTRRTKGNFAFAVHDLLRLFAEAGLQPAPVLDMRMTDLAENDPRDRPATRHEDPAERLLQGLTVRDQAGFASAPVLFLLRPAQGAPLPVEVIGLEDRNARTEAARAAQRRARYADWVRLNPWGSALIAPAARGLDLWGTTPLQPGMPVFSTSYLEFGAARMEFQLVATPSPGARDPAAIECRVMGWRPAEGTPPQTVHVERPRINQPPGTAGIGRFAIQAEEGVIYAVTGRLVRSPTLFASIDLLVRRAPR